MSVWLIRDSRSRANPPASLLPPRDSGDDGGSMDGDGGSTNSPADGGTISMVSYKAEGLGRSW